MSNYLLSLLLHVNFAARKSSLKNFSETGEWPTTPLCRVGGPGYLLLILLNLLTQSGRLVKYFQESWEIETKKVAG